MTIAMDTYCLLLKVELIHELHSYPNNFMWTVQVIHDFTICHGNVIVLWNLHDTATYSFKVKLKS